MKANRIINIMLVAGYLMLLALAYMSQIGVLFLIMLIFGIGAGGGILMLSVLRAVSRRNRNKVDG